MNKKKNNISIKSNLNNSLNEKEYSDNDLDSLDKKHNILEKSIVFYIKMIAISCFALILISISFIYIFHLVSPENRRWLNYTDLNDIKSISVAVISGVATSIITSYFFKSKK